MVAQDEDNAEDIKKKLAVRLLVPAVNIHIILNKNELRYCILEQRNLFLDTKCENLITHKRTSICSAAHEFL